MISALLSLLLAGSLHAPPAYEFHGDADLGHGTLTVSADMSHYGNIRDVTLYIGSADGQDNNFTWLHYDRKTHRWEGTFTFTKDDTPGKWYVISVDAFRGSDPSVLVARNFPNPSFWVDNH